MGINLEALEEWVVEEQDGWDNFSWVAEKEVDSPFGPIKTVEDHGGPGQGDERWVVLDVNGTLVRKNGWYASHYGSEFDGAIEIVEAYPVTVTQYRAVGS